MPLDTMKKTIAEILFILLLALFISLMYNTASPTGVKLIKKSGQKTAAGHPPTHRLLGTGRPAPLRG